VVCMNVSEEVQPRLRCWNWRCARISPRRYRDLGPGGRKAVHPNEGKLEQVPVCQLLAGGKLQ
jgi:hypothetical protein